MKGGTYCYAEKETVSPTQIQQDIIHSLQNPPNMSEASYKKWTIPFLLPACLLGVAAFLYPKLLFYGLLVLIPALLLLCTVNHFRIQYKVKKVSINDYDVTTDVLSHSSEERYVAKGHRHHGKVITNYTLHFENGADWRIPKDNYLWSTERPMSDAAIFQSSHRGDGFIVVTKKDTGKIAMAYHTDFFEYKK